MTTAAPPESAARLERWLARDCHGEMHWLARNLERRIDPRRVLPGARSIIVLATSYHRGRTGDPAARARLPASEAPIARETEEGARLREGGPDTRSARGVVARYARFADYHDVLSTPLRELSRFVEELGGAGTRSLGYVDTGPVLERDLAQRAGLGFIGKHTNVISRQLGNWSFLAEILTTLPLEPDDPERNRCGSCTRCLDTCPTRAFVAPFELDARRCISYLTIELKGSIPEELRRAIGGRIYGCDDCLEVCPWNRFAREGALMAPHRRPDLAAPDLVKLLTLDDAGFKRRFAGTPMMRSKRRGLLRNVCVALGNTGGPDCLPALERATADPEPLIVEHARWAIAEIETAGKHRAGVQA
ncbi:MAG: tRNA epoxyqueuosine(34) reductase QueG [Verrucomicrobiales bacterium]|nr:tRNA epoxyqueuosine(34) reductase QueG [Verrucomicrobiales bacterium]